jgi:hypothetical protein
VKQLYKILLYIKNNTNDMFEFNNIKNLRQGIELPTTADSSLSISHIELQKDNNIV